MNSLTLSQSDVALGLIEGIAQALEESGHKTSAGTLRRASATLARHDDEESDPAEWPAWTDSDRWEPTEEFDPSDDDMAALPLLFPEEMEDDPAYAAWVESTAMSAAWATTFGCVIEACNDPHNREV